MKKATILTLILAFCIGLTSVFAGDASAQHKKKKKHHKAKAKHAKVVKATTTNPASNHTTVHHTPGVAKHGAGATSK